MKVIWRCLFWAGIFLACWIPIGCGVMPSHFNGKKQKKAVLEDVVFRGNVLYYTHDGEPIPVSRAKVMIAVDRGVFEETFTDDEGVFRFNSLPDAEFNVQITHKNFKIWDLKEKNGITLKPSSILNTSLPVEMGFLSTVLRGRVIVDMSSAVIVMPDGTVLEEGKGSIRGDIPIGKASVYTYPPTTNTQTDSAGRFAIESDRFEPGVDFAVHVHHSAFYSGISDPFRVKISEENKAPLVKLIPTPEDSLIKEREPFYQIGRGLIIFGSGKND